MATIQLSNGQSVRVDEEDKERLEKHRWHSGGRYACRQVSRRTIYMHREITNAPAGMEVDHINGDPLDNRRSNLRLVTNAQNKQNVPVRRDSTTGARGVEFYAGRRKPYRATVWRGGKRIYTAYFATLEEAALDASHARSRLLPYSVERSRV